MHVTIVKVLRSFSLAASMALLLTHCANLTCPSGQELLDTGCVCSTTLERPVNGLCVAPVDPCEDGCPCTLDGIQAAIARGGTQLLECGDNTTIDTKETIVIDNDVTLEVRGELTVQGDGRHLMFDIRPFQVELLGLTVASGSQGIRVSDGASLTLTECVVRQNTSASSPGGGIFNEGVLTLVGTTVEDNLAAGAVDGVSGGGGIYNGSTGMLTLTESTVRDNIASAGGRGGGIRNRDGQVVVNSSEVSANTADDSGGGIINSGTLTMNDSTVLMNRANNDGGGIFNSERGTLTVTSSTVSMNTAEDRGGGIVNRGSLVLTNSSVLENTAPTEGGGIYNTLGDAVVRDTTISGNGEGTGTGNETKDGGGVFHRLGTLTLTASTVSGNMASFDGAGLYNRATLNATNCTLSGNAATDEGGGLYNHAEGTLTLAHCTVSDNTATDGGSGIGNDGEMTLTNTVIVGTCTFRASAVFSGEGNIESPGDTCILSETDNQVNVDPLDELRLGPLQDNQGPTFTQAPVAPSVAIDQVQPTSCVDADGMLLRTDQRGVERPQLALCDIGAVEVAPAP